jgi:hypothetical protein
LADGLGADRIDDFEFHQLIGQQPQCPMSIPRWRLAEPHGDQFGFACSVQAFGRWRVRTLLTNERCLEAFENKRLTHVLHSPSAAADGFADLRVPPIRTIGVRLEQDGGPPQFL